MILPEQNKYPCSYHVRYMTVEVESKCKGKHIVKYWNYCRSSCSQHRTVNYWQRQVPAQLFDRWLKYIFIQSDIIKCSFHGMVYTYHRYITVTCQCLFYCTLYVDVGKTNIIVWDYKEIQLVQYNWNETIYLTKCYSSKRPQLSDCSC
jgi:hypothetical protein